MIEQITIFTMEQLAGLAELAEDNFVETTGLSALEA
jgi:hypothetical protein